ncbi:hypothetical protein [Conexibacter woesei]|uniref:Uncharacterized protein n=1 Tax=Conexibacter woesei (strain DSM 14684 / CCUG 47730 / CIP 108061 / JCM 11494 / NBRC 100937 / ID131577) TaxID=469383 RepID=D3FB28_CONWI|nr:hypothetical protein [Conexibacter woesei]ADB53220.1 hypothetical protein Cwoe_4807 [Conexibacter woesei DSM 14684]
MPISAFRRSLDAALLDFAWAEWAQMGVLASAPRRSPWAEDPEALIIFTLEVARDDPRLFDELLDWLLSNEPLVSVRRLRTFARAPADAQLLAAALGWVDVHRPRARLRGRPAAPPVGEPARLFHDGFPVREPDPSFLSAGLLRGTVLPSGKAQSPDMRAPINLAFRLRQLLGVGARAEAVRLLLTSAAPRVGVAGLAASSGYARRNVLEAAGSLENAGVIAVSRMRGDHRFTIDKSRWADFLGLGANELPEGRDWPHLFAALVGIRRGLAVMEAEDLSDYMLASRARDLLAEVTDFLMRADVPVVENAGIEAAWSDLEQAAAAAVGALSSAGGRDRRGRSG